MIDLNKTLKDLTAACLEIGQMQCQNFRRKDLKVDAKSSPADLVTEIDKKSEAMIIQHIKERFPTHSILAEESGFSGNNSEHLWTIDPLDGTNNFAHGIPIFAISIAYSFRGQANLGLVYAPYLNELYTAILGQGAFCNHEPIHISGKRSLDRSVVATGFPYIRNELFDKNLEYVNRLAPKVAGLRRLGAAAYDLSLVASGRLDAFWELNLSPWDVAAGNLIVSEAGGKVIELSITKPDKPSLIAANSDLANEIFNLFSEGVST